jgi:hypothetical protein
VYDVTDRGSFNSIRNWVGQIQQVPRGHRGGGSRAAHHFLFVCGQHADVHVNKILIGNKCDMDDQRVSVPRPLLLLLRVARQRHEHARRWCPTKKERSSRRSTAYSFSRPAQRTTSKSTRCAPSSPILLPLALSSVQQGFVAIAREVKNRLIADGPAAVRTGLHTPGKGEKRSGKACC